MEKALFVIMKISVILYFSNLYFAKIYCIRNITNNIKKKIANDLLIKKTQQTK